VQLQLGLAHAPANRAIFTTHRWLTTRATRECEGTSCSRPLRGGGGAICSGPVRVREALVLACFERDCSALFILALAHPRGQAGDLQYNGTAPKIKLISVMHACIVMLVTPMSMASR
jgi:hypothetical protein